MTAPPVAHHWSPITDLPEDPLALAVAELRSLGSVWREQRAHLEASGALERFLVRLRREWAIETGMIERLYQFDQGVTLTLIEQGIDASFIPHQATNGEGPERVARLILDQESVVEGLFDFVGGSRDLTVSYIKELHAQLTRNQTHTDAIDQFGTMVRIPLLRGAFKQLPNDPTLEDGSVHQYCPPTHVAAEMDRLVDLSGAHGQAGVPPEVEAAWLHHRFTQIHPFQDGNGRMARTLATLVFLKAGWFPLVVPTTDRKTYLEHLRSADRGDLGPLVEYFASIQRNTFVRALGMAGQVTLEHENFENVIRAAARRIEARERPQRSDWESVLDTGEQLRAFAETRFREVQERLTDELGPSLDHFHAFVHSKVDDPDGAYFNRWQVIQIAREQDYFANLRVHHSFARLVLEEGGTRFELMVSIHGAGRDFGGVIAASAFTFFRDRQSGSQQEAGGATDLRPAVREAYQANYMEDPEAAVQRFRSWLERAVVNAIAEWQRQF